MLVLYRHFISRQSRRSITTDSFCLPEFFLCCHGLFADCICRSFSDAFFLRTSLRILWSSCSYPCCYSCGKAVYTHLVSDEKVCRCRTENAGVAQDDKTFSGACSKNRYAMSCMDHACACICRLFMGYI